MYFFPWQQEGKYIHFYNYIKRANALIYSNFGLFKCCAKTVYLGEKKEKL